MNTIKNMKIKNLIIISTVLIIVVACGKPDQPNEATTFYKKTLCLKKTRS